MNNMMKKLLLIATTGIIFIGALPNMSLNTQYENRSVYLVNIEALTYEWDDEDDDIDLRGSLIWMETKSYPSVSTPFQATKYSSYINVRYLVNPNNIAMQIVRASEGTVYSTNVNSVAGEQLSVSLAGLSSGAYTVVFTDSNGSRV
jgi:hypothetical protein